MKPRWWKFQLDIHIRNTFMGWHNVIIYYCLLEKLTTALNFWVNCHNFNWIWWNPWGQHLAFLQTWTDWIQAIIQSMLSISHMPSVQINLACCLQCLTSILTGVTPSSWGFQLMSRVNKVLQFWDQTYLFVCILTS